MKAPCVRAVALTAGCPTMMSGGTGSAHSGPPRRQVVSSSSIARRANQTVMGRSEREGRGQQGDCVGTTTAVQGGDEMLRSYLPIRARVSIGAPSTRLSAPSGGASDTTRRWDIASGEPLSDPAARSDSTGFRHVLTSSSGRATDYTRPPIDPGGTLCNASDRPLLCLSVWGSEVVVGGADHALYVYDIGTGRPLRRLYTKTQGHIDWVSTVAHLSDGRVLSGGGDGKVCLWSTGRSVFCYNLDGHASAVSKVMTVQDSRLALSGGYDGKIKLWDMGTRRILTCLDGLEPVMDYAWGGNDLMGGTRKGMCQVWDLTSGDLVRTLKAHKGHATCVVRWGALEGQANGACFISGGQDGLVRVWDSRAKLCSHKIEAHTSPQCGTGAVSCIEVTAATGLVSTGGADKRVCVLDPRASFRPLHVLTDHADFVYSLCAADDALFSGSGSGMLLCHSLVDGRLMYGVGANQGAVRIVQAAGTDRLVAAGDDGKLVIYQYQ